MTVEDETASSKPQAASSKQQTANRKPQTANHTANRPTTPHLHHALTPAQIGNDETGRGAGGGGEGMGDAQREDGVCAAAPLVHRGCGATLVGFSGQQQLLHVRGGGDGDFGSALREGCSSNAAPRPNRLLPPFEQVSHLVAVHLHVPDHKCYGFTVT